MVVAVSQVIEGAIIGAAAAVIGGLLGAVVLGVMTNTSAAAQRSADAANVQKQLDESKAALEVQIRESRASLDRQLLHDRDMRDREHLRTILTEMARRGLNIAATGSYIGFVEAALSASNPGDSELADASDEYNEYTGGLASDAAALGLILRRDDPIIKALIDLYKRSADLLNVVTRWRSGDMSDDAFRTELDQANAAQGASIMRFQTAAREALHVERQREPNATG